MYLINTARYINSSNMGTQNASQDGVSLSSPLLGQIHIIGLSPSPKPMAVEGVTHKSYKYHEVYFIFLIWVHNMISVWLCIILTS